MDVPSHGQPATMGSVSGTRLYGATLCSSSSFSSALKLRYSLPIVMPSSKRRDASTRPGTPGSGGGGTPVVSPIASTITFPAGIAPDDAIIFDAPLVARMEEGWELMLERVVFKWMEAVVSERRGER